MTVSSGYWSSSSRDEEEKKGKAEGCVDICSSSQFKHLKAFTAFAAGNFTLKMVKLANFPLLFFLQRQKNVVVFFKS